MPANESWGKPLNSAYLGIIRQEESPWNDRRLYPKRIRGFGDSTFDMVKYFRESGCMLSNSGGGGGACISPVLNTRTAHKITDHAPLSLSLSVRQPGTRRTTNLCLEEATTTYTRTAFCWIVCARELYKWYSPTNICRRQIPHSKYILYILRLHIGVDKEIRALADKKYSPLA